MLALPQLIGSSGPPAFPYLQFTLPEETHLALIDTMVQCCVAAMPTAPAEAAQHGLDACSRLDVEHSGVLAWPPKHHNGRCLFAAQRARQMVETAAAAQAADPEVAPVVRELLTALVFILDDCLVGDGLGAEWLSGCRCCALQFAQG